jgi:hypothetical protein
VKQSLFACLMVVSALFVCSQAQASTYTLTLTDTANPGYSGTGTLVIVGTPPTSGTDEYCISGGCGGGTLTSLTFSVDGFSYSSADPGAGFTSATFTNGTLTALAFGETDGGNDQLQLPYSGGLTYSFNSYSDPSLFTTGTISDVLAATPLPATLPLFAGGLGFVGYLAKRRKRNATQALATA